LNIQFIELLNICILIFNYIRYSYLIILDYKHARKYTRKILLLAISPCSRKRTVHAGITIRQYDGLVTSAIGVKGERADIVKRQNTSDNRRDFTIVFSVSILIWILCNRRYLRVRIYLTSTSSRDQAEAHSD